MEAKEIKDLIKENYELSFMTLCESFKINSNYYNCIVT